MISSLPARSVTNMTSYRVDVDGGRKFSRRHFGLQGRDYGVEAPLVRRVRDDVDAVPVGLLHGLQVKLQRRLPRFVVFGVVGKTPEEKSRPVVPMETEKAQIDQERPRARVEGKQRGRH